MITTEIAIYKCFSGLFADFSENLSEFFNPEDGLHVSRKIFARVNHFCNEILKSELVAAIVCLISLCSDCFTQSHNELLISNNQSWDHIRLHKDDQLILKLQEVCQ